MRETHRFQEPHEVARIPRKPFGPNLLVYVQAGIGIERSRAVIGANHEREQAELLRLVQIEGRQLRRHEGVQCAVQRAPAKQIDPAAPKLPGARSGQYEAPPRRLLHHRVDHRQEFRHALDLVDHHRSDVRCTRKQLAQTLRTSRERSMQRGIQQVEVQGVGKPLPQERGFARSARSEQKAASLRNSEKST